MILGFFREVDENCSLPQYAAITGNSLPTFRDNLSGPILKGTVHDYSVCHRNTFRCLRRKCPIETSTDRA